MWRKWNEQISSLNHYKRFIQQNGIYFENANNQQFKMFKFPLSFFNLTLPTMFSLVYGIRAFVSLYYKTYFNNRLSRLRIMSEFLYLEIRSSVEVTLLCWSMLHFLISVYVLNQHILKYQLFAPLVCDYHTKISPENLGLYPPHTP